MIDTSCDVKTAMEARNGTLTVKRTQDVEPYLEANRRMQGEQAGGWMRNMRRNRRQVAEIPNIVVEMWLKQGFNIFQCTENELRRKLDEPEWQYLKTIPGKLGKRSRHI